MASTNQQFKPGSYRAEMDDAERASRMKSSHCRQGLG